MIKLVASDVDGTILKSTDISLKESLFDMICKLNKKGILFVAASGRPYCELRELFKPVYDKMGFIACDGAMSLVGNNLIDVHGFNLDEAKMLLEDVRNYKECEFIAYSLNAAFSIPKTDAFKEKIHKLLYGNEFIVNSVSDINANVLKIGIYNEAGIANVENFFLDKYSNKFEVTYDANNWLEFNSFGINKACGINSLIKALGITKDETIAFGDSFNDLEMFEAVGLSFAMASAKDIIKNKASNISNDVEMTVRKLLL